MSTPKAEVVTMIEALPDNSSFEDIQYHLYVLGKVRRGIARACNEGALTHAEVKAQLGKWPGN